MDEVQPASTARDAIQYSMLVPSSIFRPQRPEGDFSPSGIEQLIDDDTITFLQGSLCAVQFAEPEDSSSVAPGHLVLHEYLACVEKSN